MDLEFLSGLLLGLVVLAIAAYIVKELYADRAPSATPGGIKDTLGKHLNSEAKPVNEHLIGMTGAVIAHSEDTERPMNVRLGVEVWPARTDAGEERLPVGTRIEVTAVEEPIVLIRRAEQDAAAAEEAAPGG